MRGQGHHCLAAALVHAALRRQIASDVWSGVHGCAALCPPGVGVEAVARRELLSEALTHYSAAAALQESSDCARPTPFASRLATEGEPPPAC